jgi:hypothetical protein
MKKRILILAISLSFGLSACKKNAETAQVITTANNTELVVTAENTLNVQSVKNLPSQDLKRVAFGLLKPIEKYLLWLDNIKTVSADFNPEQKIVTAELIAFLSPQLFSVEKVAPATIEFRDKWLAKAEKAFTKEQIRMLAYQIFVNTDSKSNLTINIAEIGAGLPQCDCKSGSEFSCDDKSLCPTDKLSGECKNPSSWGCGFCGFMACDNKCFTPQLPD